MVLKYFQGNDMSMFKPYSRREILRIFDLFAPYT